MSVNAPKVDRLGVIGGGAWGTAMAQVIASDGSDVLLWAREPEVVAAVNADHANPLFLPGLSLSPSIRATGALADLAGCDALVVVVPAQFVRSVLADLPCAGKPLVLCAKGMEAGSRQLMSEVAAAV
ncbi:MAG: NAD(P)-binding domain-containing protein, partial [Alphaproteobacteria bacterium]